MGAMLGLSFTARHPERVSRLVLVGCGTYDETCRVRFNQHEPWREVHASAPFLTKLEAWLKQA